MPPEIAEPKTTTRAKSAPVDTRTRVAWALFKHNAALSSGHTRIPALAASDTMRIFVDIVAGETVLSVEDPSLPAPGLIPWNNVAALGLVP